MAAPIAITGSTGGIGGIVARTLAEQEVPQRLLVRDAARAPRLEGAEVAVTEYRDAERSRDALAGIRTLLMVSGSESADRVDEHRAFVAAAADAGVEHIVYTSFVGAAPDATFTLARDHGATEEAIRASGMAFTFLRDNLYTDFLELLAGEDGVIRGPAGDGRAATVTRADVAAVAVEVLQNPSAHAGATYDLTGPEALSLDEVAAILSSATGRPFAYQRETYDEALASRAVYRAPDWQVEAWVSTYVAIASGDLEAVSDDIPALLGRPAVGLRGFLAAR